MTRRAALSAGAVALVGGGFGGWRWLGDRGVDAPAGPPASTSSATVTRTDLNAREQVGGTVGYLGDWLVAHPGPAGVLTVAPAPTTVVGRGQALYEVDGRAVVLLYGDRPVWRDLELGITPGEDIRQLEQNLTALGFSGLTEDDRFTEATAAAVRRWQQTLGRPQTGRLTVGTVVFASEAVRIIERLAVIGTRVEAGPLLRVSSTRRAVLVALPISRQGQVRVGAGVDVTLPGGQGRVPGTVAEMGQAAGEGATVPVTVTVDQAVVADDLDRAPVQVAITTARRTGVLAVPLTALRAAATAGTYEITVLDGDARRSMLVRPGLLDERAGLIEVTGDGLVEGMRVEVPAR